MKQFNANITLIKHAYNNAYKFNVRLLTTIQPSYRLYNHHSTIHSNYIYTNHTLSNRFIHHSTINYTSSAKHDSNDNNTNLQQHNFDTATGVVELDNQQIKQLLGLCIYKSPFSDTLRRVKRLSLTSCILSIFSSPFLVILSPPSIPLQGSLSMIAVILTFGIGTTYGLNKFSRGYITSLYTQNNNNNRIIAQTLNITGKPRYRSLPLNRLSNTSYDAELSVVYNLFVNLPNHKKHSFYIHEHMVEFEPIKRLYENDDNDNEQNNEQK